MKNKKGFSVLVGQRNLSCFLIFILDIFYASYMCICFAFSFDRS